MSRPEPLVRVPEAFDTEFPDGSRLATETFINIGMLTGGVQSAVESLVAEEGLPSMAAFNVLSVLGGDPHPLRPSTIAERMMVTRATMTGVLDSLERRGFVKRVASAHDGRSREVTLTAKGRSVVERLVPAMHRFERDFMSALTDDEQRRLLRSVAVLQASIAALAPAANLGIR